MKPSLYIIFSVLIFNIACCQIDNKYTFSKNIYRCTIKVEIDSVEYVFTYSCLIKADNEKLSIDLIKTPNVITEMNDYKTINSIIHSIGQTTFNIKRGIDIKLNDDFVAYCRSFDSAINNNSDPPNSLPKKAKMAFAMFFFLSITSNFNLTDLNTGQSIINNQNIEIESQISQNIKTKTIISSKNKILYRRVDLNFEKGVIIDSGNMIIETIEKGFFDKQHNNS